MFACRMSSSTRLAVTLFWMAGFFTPAPQCQSSFHISLHLHFLHELGGANTEPSSESNLRLDITEIMPFQVLLSSL